MFNINTIIILVVFLIAAPVLSWVDNYLKIKGLRADLKKSDKSIEDKIDFVIDQLGKLGFQIKNRSSKQVQMVQPKKFSFFFALLWFLCFGIGLVIYLIWYAAKSDWVETFTFAEKESPELPST